MQDDDDRDGESQLRRLQKVEALVTSICRHSMRHQCHEIPIDKCVECNPSETIDLLASAVHLQIMTEAGVRGWTITISHAKSGAVMVRKHVTEEGVALQYLNGNDWIVGNSRAKLSVREGHQGEETGVELWAQLAGRSG